MKLANHSVPLGAVLGLTLCLLVSGLAAAAAPQGYVAPLAGSLGVVTIYPNGTISNPSAPIVQSGSTYQLTGELNGSLMVLASGVVVDGMGFTVNYTVGEPGGTGAAVTVANASGDTIQGFLSTNAVTGLYVYNTTQTMVQGNSVAGSTYDIEVANSSGVSISGNNATGALDIGIEVYGSTNVTVTGNQAMLAVTGIDIEYSSFTTVAINSVGLTTSYAVYADYTSFLNVSGNNGSGSFLGFEADNSAQVAFFQNNASFSYDGFGTDAAQNVRIVDNQAFESVYGEWSDYTTNLVVDANYLPFNTLPLQDDYAQNLLVQDNYGPWSGASYEGISSEYSYNVTYTGNNLSNSQDEAVYLYDTGNVTLTNNNLSNAVYYGLYAYYTYGGLVVAGNNISESAPSSFSEGVYLYEVRDPSTISGNLIGNQEYGVDAEDCYGPVTVQGNTIANSTYAATYFYDDYASVSVLNNSLVNASSYGVESYYQYGGSALTVSGNEIDNAGYAGVYDYEDGYATSALVVTHNDIRNSVSYGVYGYYIEGPTTIVGNNLSDSQYIGVEVSYGDYAATTIAQNDISNAGDEGIYVYEGLGVTVANNRIVNATYYAIDLEYDYGVDVISGNDVAHAQYTAIYDYSNYASVDVLNNNATGALSYGLDLEDANSVGGDMITGNDFSGAASVYTYYDSIGTFAANNLLHVASIDLNYDTIDLFYHNSVNSSAFSPYGTVLSGTGWNANYPVGGNFWTGYSGTDAYSGPGQNIPGSDGIGDTPYSIAGATDFYPLMGPWTAATVTFVETGLPAGATWTVTLNGVVASGPAATPLGFAQSNGAFTAFAYTVGSSDVRYTATPRAGTGIEDGVSQTILVMFAPDLHTVSFTQTTLPTSTTWTVTLNGTSKTATGGTISFSELNGTYAYSVSPVAGYTVAPAGGTVHVTGATTVALNFTAVHYTVVFVESGLPGGASWSVTLNGSTISATSTSLSFSMPNGTYAFTTKVPTGYNVTPSKDSVQVAGTGSTIYVSAYPAGSSTPTNQTPTPTTPTTSTSSSSTPLVYGLAGALVVALVLAGLGWLLFLRRQKPGAGTSASPTLPAGALGTPGPTPPPPGTGTPPNPP